MKPKILIGPSTFAASDQSPLERLTAAGYAVVDNPFKRKLTKAELLNLLDDQVIGLIAGLETIDREVMEKSSIKVISRVGAGIANVDLIAARELDIGVFNTPDAPTNAVAELTIGALLSLMRLIPQMDHDLHEGKWIKKIGGQLQGKTVAVVGYGRIGRRVAALLAAFGARLLIVDPYIRQIDVADFSLVNLTEALSRADIISIHVSGNDCLIGDKEFALMKKGALLLNAARGGVIAEEALLKALKSGATAGAWLDTFGEEPYSGPFCGLANVILTPHVGSYTAECRLQMESEAVENLINHLKNIGVGK